MCMCRESKPSSSGDKETAKRHTLTINGLLHMTTYTPGVGWPDKSHYSQKKYFMKFNFWVTKVVLESNVTTHHPPTKKHHTYDEAWWCMHHPYRATCLQLGLGQFIAFSHVTGSKTWRAKQFPSFQEANI